MTRSRADLSNFNSNSLLNNIKFNKSLNKTNTIYLVEGSVLGQIILLQMINRTDPNKSNLQRRLGEENQIECKHILLGVGLKLLKAYY